MRNFLATVLLAAVVACSDGVVQPHVLDLDASAANIVDRFEVCHVDEFGNIRSMETAGPALAAHLRHGDAFGGRILPPGSTFSASQSWNPPGQPAGGFDPHWAFDGIVEAWSQWNSGDFPTQWIEVDFGTAQRFSVITAIPSRLPVTGSATHHVYLDGVLAITWSGTETSAQPLTHDFGAFQQAQRIRITTTSSASWVAWFEVQIIGCAP